MLPQNLSNEQVQSQPSHQFSAQSSHSSFMPSNTNFDSSAYFNLDPSQAAKQMAALNAANNARIINGRSSVPSTSLPPNGTNSASYLGGIHTANNPNAPSIGHDSFSNNQAVMQGQSGPHMTNNHNHALPHVPPNLATNPSFIDSPNSMSHSNSAARAAMQKSRLQFLNGLATVHQKRGTPLPPQLTGTSTNPPYDPNNTQWKSLEPTVAELGVIRIAGKDIDLMRFWSTVHQIGGIAAVNNNNSWGMVLSQLGLPEYIPQAQGNGTTPVAPLLSQHYLAILYPFEEAYNLNIKDQQRKAQLAARQMGAGQHAPTGMSPRPNAPNMMGMMTPSTPGHQQPGSAGSGRPQAPQTPHLIHSTTGAAPNQSMGLRTPTQGTPQKFTAHGSAESLANMGSQQQTPDVNVLDGDSQGLKRKLDSEEVDDKRAKQKIGSEPPEANSPAVATGLDRSSVGPSGTPTTNPTQAPVMPIPPRPRTQPSRRKIEYLPLARDIDTYGGRDLRYIETEIASLPQRRPWRDVNDWGTVDIEALTMSVRSRLANELSYALTTLTLLSTMRGQTPGSGFPINQCSELLDELLDLLEDLGFDSAEDTDEPDDTPIATHRELITAYHEVQSASFAVLHPHQGAKDPNLGPKPRSAAIITTVINIIRNLTSIPDNLEYLARHERLLDLLLRLCSVELQADGTFHACARVLSLGDVVTVRKDTLYTLTTTAYMTHFSTTMPPSKSTLRMANRVFRLISSYLVDPSEALSPLASVQVVGAPSNAQVRPPTLADTALEVWTRISQSDANRRVFSKAVSQAGLWLLLESLVHRLPVVDADFQLMTREMWLSYLEKNIMALYSLAFLSPPELKKRMKSDRKLGFTGVMFRIIQRFLMNTQENRPTFMICTRRAIETMKVVDDGEDSFDTPKSTNLPPLSFGMGYGEIGENGDDKGTGMLGGYRGVAWDLLMMREVGADDVMFSELESLARIE